MFTFVRIFTLLQVLIKCLQALAVRLIGQATAAIGAFHIIPSLPGARCLRKR